MQAAGSAIFYLRMRGRVKQSSWPKTLRRWWFSPCTQFWTALLIKRASSCVKDGMREYPCPIPPNPLLWYDSLSTCNLFYTEDFSVRLFSRPLFFRKIVGIEHLPLRAAILVLNVPSLAWRWVSNLLWGRGPVWQEARKIASFSPPLKPKGSAPSGHLRAPCHKDNAVLGQLSPGVVT